MISGVLKPKSEEEIDLILNKLPPAKRVSALIRREVEVCFYNKDVTHDDLLKKVEETVNRFSENNSVNISIGPTTYEPNTFAASVNIIISENVSDNHTVLTMTHVQPQ